MAPSPRAARIQERTIDHRGTEIGEEMVTLTQNQTDPQRKTEFIAFECPRKFNSIRYSGNRHWTKMILRTLVEIEDAPASTTQSLDHDLIPVAGEEDIEDQPFPIVVGYNVTQGERLELVDVNYSQNEVVLSEAPTADDHLKFYPCISRGAVQYRGVNQFNQTEGALDKWTTPVYRWLDFDQDKRGTEINLQGSIEWTRYESLQMVLDSEQQVVWEDEHYPDGAFVSQFEQRVDIEL